MLFRSAVVDEGRTILFTTVSGVGRPVMSIDAISTVTKQRRRVVERGGNPIYAPSGHLIFFRDASLLAIPFNVTSLETTGPAVAALDNIALDQLGGPMVALSPTGLLAYVDVENATKELVWLTRQGIEQPISEARRAYTMRM